jgi:hypothetical protein
VTIGLKVDSEIISENALGGIYDPAPHFPFAKNTEDILIMVDYLNAEN